MDARRAISSPHGAGGVPDGAALADIVRRRGVRRVAYFHCDHFEPWRKAPGSASFAENADDIVRFGEECAANEFARRLTLFYKPRLYQGRVGRDRGVRLATAQDVIGFVDTPPALRDAAEAAMRTLVATVGHEFQVHVHHEGWTYNSSHEDPALVAAFARPEIRALDTARFELGLGLTLEAIRRETGLPLDRWFFVHGKWALNGSDPAVCHIADEIEVLMRTGARGDFTFPAGRRHVDPGIEQPYFARPVAALRGYELPEAEPEAAFGNAAAATAKFFVWASAIRHGGSSLDHYSDWVVEKLASPELFAREILELSHVAGDTLWFKTHGHSMHARYRREGEPATFPHGHAGVQRLLGTVFDAATHAGADVEFLTASEVYDRFTTGRPPPPGGFALPPAATATISAGPAPVLLHRELVNRIAVEGILAEVAKAGANGSGARPYYLHRAQRGEVLMDYELRIAEALAREPAGIARIVEVGSGASLLPMLLAANGIASFGFDRDPARVALACRLRDRIAARIPAAAACVIELAAAPAALEAVKPADTALVFTNMTGENSAEDLAAIVTLAARFRVVAIDASRFFAVRDEREQAELIGSLGAAGWGAPTRLSSDPTETYWLFRHPC